MVTCGLSLNAVFGTLSYKHRFNLWTASDVKGLEKAVLLDKEQLAPVLSVYKKVK